MKRIIHYRDKCIGCYACVEVAPDRWRISRKDGKSVLLGGIQKKNTWSVLIHDIELPENIQASENCPVNVIRVI